MRDEILGQLKAALPVDGAVFNLHGAMVAHGYDDCEGDFLERVRALVGPKAASSASSSIRIAISPAKRCALADVIVLFKEYPHTDFAERGEEMVDLDAARHPPRDQAGEIRVRLPHDRRAFRPRSSRCAASSTSIMALEGKDRVLSVSIGALLSLRRCAGMRRAHPGAHRRRQAAWRQARRRDRPRADRVARAGGAAGIFASTARSMRRWRTPAARS